MALPYCLMALRRAAGRARRALFPSPERRALAHARARAHGAPRRTAASIEMMGYQLEVPDLLTFCPQWESIFVHESLRFRSESQAPRILDGGANLGLASLYFKRLYPKARITAFEADPAIAALAKGNLERNGAGDVEVVRAALWTEEGTVSFHAEGADSGAVTEAGAASGSQQVPCVRLRDILARARGAGTPVDLLKLDIEGAEEAVLRDAAPELATVRALVVEIHETDPGRRRTPALLEILTAAGFVYTLDELYPLDAPPSGTASIEGSAPPFPGAPLQWVIRARAWKPAAAAARS